jgi:hypothetical protein
VWSTLKVDEMGFRKSSIGLRNGVSAEVMITGPHFMPEAVTQFEG